MSTKWVEVTSTNSIPIKEGRKICFKDQEVALFNLGNEYLAVDNHCPHKRGPLSDGIVSGKAVFCPLHNWKISLENGCAQAGGRGNVKTYPVKVIGSKVCIAVDQGKLHLDDNALTSAEPAKDDMKMANQ